MVRGMIRFHLLLLLHQGLDSSTIRFHRLHLHHHRGLDRNTCQVILIHLHILDKVLMVTHPKAIMAPHPKATLEDSGMDWQLEELSDTCLDPEATITLTTSQGLLIQLHLDGEILGLEALQVDGVLLDLEALHRQLPLVPALLRDSVEPSVAESRTGCCRLL